MEIYPNSKQPAIATAPFGMSACGRAFAGVTGGVTFVTRGRMDVTWGATGLAAAAHIPGTSAWSPPVS